MGGACDIQGGKEKCIVFYFKMAKEKEHLEDLGLDEREY
jgi:hypothetical protein